MMQPIHRGHYCARLADLDSDVHAAQRLRWICFHGQSGADDNAQALDHDPLDDECRHLLVEDLRSGALVCCFRFLPLSDGSQIGRSYSAQFYDLRALEGFDGPMIEMGRFCVHPDHGDPDIVRIAWAAMTQFVADSGAEMLFGCSSFMGCEPGPHREAFAMLRARHLAPGCWLPRVKAPRVFRFARALRRYQPDARQAMAAMPPLLRSYLAMGGWVSDHAVVDTALRTMHVFTGLEIRAIPPGRRRLLQSLAG